MDRPFAPAAERPPALAVLRTAVADRLLVISEPGHGSGDDRGVLQACASRRISRSSAARLWPPQLVTKSRGRSIRNTSRRRRRLYYGHGFLVRAGSARPRRRLIEEARTVAGMAPTAIRLDA